YTLPLAARQIDAVGIAAGEHRIETGQPRSAGVFNRLANHGVRSAAGGHVVAERQLEADEILKYGGDSRAPANDLQRPYGHASHFDRARLRIVKAAKKLGNCRLAGAILADDGERRTRGYRNIES